MHREIISKKMIINLRPNRPKTKGNRLLLLASLFILINILQKQFHINCVQNDSRDSSTVVAGNSTSTTSAAAAAEVEFVDKNNQQQEALLKQSERITVVAPKYLRPQGDYNVLLTLANSQVPATIELQLTGGRDSNREQVEARSVLVNSGETQTIKFSIGDWQAAEYILSVNAQAVDRSWQFQQEAAIQYYLKSYSGFIQTDKAIYKPGEMVKFRAIFLSETLQPILMKDEINVTISDPRKNLIRQWKALSNYRGLITLEMQLSDDPMLGDWTISVDARGQQFSKQFTIAEYILPTYKVDIQLPPYATYNDSQLIATVRATYTYGKPVRGHVTLTVQPLVRFANIDTRPLEQIQYKSRLGDEGKADFEIDIKKHLSKFVDLFEREVEFFALVEEDLTGRKYNRTEQIKIFHKSIKIERLNEKVSFKPGLSQLMQYKVAYQDDIPVENHGHQVILDYSFWGQSIGEFKLRPINGLIEHELIVPQKIKRPNPRVLGRLTDYYYNESDLSPTHLDIKATYRGQTHYLNQIIAFKSQSNQYLQINFPQLEQKRSNLLTKQSENSINIGDQLKINLKSTEPIKGQVNCQGLARGNIIWALSLDGKNKSELEFSIQVDQRMAPEAQVLCFYIRPENKELIVDSELVSINGFMRNFVKLSPNREEVKPSQQVEVDVFTKPNSLVGILAIDQSVLLLKSGNDISTKQVFDDSKRFSNNNNNVQTSIVTADNAESLFDLANMVVITNNLFKPETDLSGRSGNLMYMNAAAATDKTFSKIALSNLVLDQDIQPPEFHLSEKRFQNLNSIKIRSEFPETWLWQNGTADSSGKLNFNAKIPDTITTWQLSAFSLSEAHGFGLAPGQTDDGRPATTIRVFKPFFIKLNLPYSIIRGETVSVQAIIFNYSKRPTAAKVSLDNSLGEFEFIEAANSIEDERRFNKSLESRLLPRIPANDGVSVSFLIRPLKLGRLDIKVLAQGELAGDGIVRKLLVKPEGQVQHFNRAMLIRLPLSSIENDENQDRNLFKRNVSINVPANAVRDSQRVQVSAIGDILGAGLTNVDDLLRLPYGCGEQNMINLVPNIVIYNYLLNTKRLRQIQKEKAIKNIQTGYQRQLNYKRPDGSFSAFGPSDSNGSLWLTSYVLKTFQQAKQIITIDQEIINEASKFIQKFIRPDGSFEEIGMLHNKELSSEAATNANSHIYLTAYALIALLEGPLSPPIDRQLIDRGLNYLTNQLDNNQSENDLPINLAMIAYTMQLAGNKPEVADRAYEKLWSLAQEDRDLIWWPMARGVGKKKRVEEESRGSLTLDDGESVNNDFETINNKEQQEGKKRQSTIPPLKPLPVKTKQSAHMFTPDSLTIEATSMALLTAVRRNHLDRALPIVRWLIGQQNSNGGFASTQDTVLAIEALAAFAQATSATKPTNNSNGTTSMEIELLYPRVKRSSQFRKTNSDQLQVDESNSLIQQQLNIMDNITWIQIQAKGSGVAVVQVSWQYNLLVSAEEPAFYLNPILDKTSTSNYLQLSICTFYKGPNGESSNMAVVEVELPSGYVADAEALPGLKRHKAIKRVDTEDGETKVIIYLDRVTNKEELCFTVPAHRSTKVSNNKPVPVTIYDYYDRRQTARIFYEPQPASSCDICEQDTCSEQCSSKPKRSEKLISLHEQRRLINAQLAESVENNSTTHSKLLDDDSRNRTIGRRIPGRIDFNTTFPDARELLPLTPVLESLKKTLRNGIGG